MFPHLLQHKGRYVRLNRQTRSGFAEVISKSERSGTVVHLHIALKMKDLSGGMMPSVLGSGSCDSPAFSGPSPQRRSSPTSKKSLAGTRLQSRDVPPPVARPKFTPEKALQKVFLPNEVNPTSEEYSDSLFVKAESRLPRARRSIPQRFWKQNRPAHVLKHWNRGSPGRAARYP